MPLTTTQVLKTIESAYDRGLKGEDFKSAVRPTIMKHLPTRYHGDDRKDNISHFTLRLGLSERAGPADWPPPSPAATAASGRPLVRFPRRAAAHTPCPPRPAPRPVQRTAGRRRSGAGS